MTKQVWVLDKLKECNFDIVKVSKKEQFDDYVDETNSLSTYESYCRYIRKIAQKVRDISQEIEEAPNELPLQDNYDTLVSILEEEIKQRGVRLRMSDLNEIAYRHKFSPSSFSLYIPNLPAFLSNVYKINGLDIENDIDVYRLKQKIRVLSEEVNLLKTKHADYSNLLNALSEITTLYVPWEVPNIIVSHKENLRAVGALFSDLHAGELVSKEETLGLNEYNQDIMKDRIDKFFNQLINYGQEVKVNVLYLKMLGDMVNGEIHEELIRNSDLDSVEALILVADYVSQWIRRISEFFKEINIIAVSGNHGRFSKKPIYKKAQTLNFDYLAYEFMKRETKSIVKSFVLPKSQMIISSILGYRFLTMHGSLLKGGTGLQPASGTWLRDTTKLKGLYEKYGGFQFVEFAHFHTPILDFPSFDGTSIIVNGAVKGADEFSIGAVKSGSRPAQVVYVIEKGVGMKFRSVLYLD